MLDAHDQKRCGSHPHAGPTAPVYLDHAATSPLRPVCHAALAENAGLVGNPAALHGGGRAARALLEDAREELAQLVGAHPDEVIFTSGGSEADSIALLGAATRWAAERPGVVVGAIEHPAVATIGVSSAERVQLLPVDEGGHYSIERLTALLRRAQLGSVGIVSTMLVNNEVGTIQSVAVAAEAAHHYGAWLHTDAVQAFGQVKVDFAGSVADLMSLSAHKIGGPVGIGALIVRRGTVLGPYGLGGKQEGGLRSGTQAAVLAAGFAAAAREAVAGRADQASRLAGFKAQLIATAQAIGAVTVNGDEPASPAIVNLGFAGASAEDVMFLCDQHQIWCATGSACRAGVHLPSEVLLAMGRDEQAATEGVRFSFGWSTSQADLDRTCAVLPAVVARARSVPR